ncbi:hypothetical protein Tco_1122545 [Tanacetum coccineum]|uniref:Uncharacterized protein n=1 Tax=Tanacetum coccineum TaxID=301880 RepID=A0ABQ5J284_9ASTR
MFESFEDESEPIEDAPEVAKLLPTQVIPPPPVHISPTLPAEPTPTPPIIPHDTRATSRMTVRPQPPFPLGYRASIARWSNAPLTTPRSRHVSSSSSSSTSHTQPGPLPRRRHLVSSYSTPSASVRPSRKRCRSLTTSLLATTSAPAILSYVPADRLPPHKRFRDMPLSWNEETEEELQTLRARVVSSERENTPLRARVRAAELSDDST